MCVKISRRLALSLLFHRFGRVFILFLGHVLLLLGLLSTLWFVGWCFFAYNSPSEHPRITYAEKLYLLRSVPKPKRVNCFSFLHRDQVSSPEPFHSVSYSMVSYRYLCATLCHCSQSCMHKFRLLHSLNILTNVFLYNPSF